MLCLGNMPQSSGLYTSSFLYECSGCTKLLDAGAIPMGVIWCVVHIGWINNTVYGRSNNPMICVVLPEDPVVEKVLWLVVADLHLDLGRISVVPFECLLLMVFMISMLQYLIENTGQYPLHQMKAQRYLCTLSLEGRRSPITLIHHLDENNRADIDWSKTKYVA